MKTKYWVALLAAVVLICAIISAVLLTPGQAQAVRVISQGKVLHTLPLGEDTRLEIVSDNGVNVITVKDGMVAVTEANCPDQHCVNRGFCSGGAQIVCLPNRLVLEFVEKQTVDGVAG